MKIFISGQVSGLDYQSCYEKFQKAKLALIRAGFSEAMVVNPMADLSLSPHTDWEVAMAICLGALSECQAIYMLTDWKFSPGARMEKYHANRWGLEVYYEQNDDIRLISYLLQKSMI